MRNITSTFTYTTKEVSDVVIKINSKSDNIGNLAKEK
jgi:hypothetical protein